MMAVLCEMVMPAGVLIAGAETNTGVPSYASGVTTSYSAPASSSRHRMQNARPVKALPAAW